MSVSSKNTEGSDNSEQKRLEILHGVAKQSGFQNCIELFF